MLGTQCWIGPSLCLPFPLCHWDQAIPISLESNSARVTVVSFPIYSNSLLVSLPPFASLWSVSYRTDKWVFWNTNWPHYSLVPQDMAHKLSIVPRALAGSLSNLQPHLPLIPAAIFLSCNANHFQILVSALQAFKGAMSTVWSTLHRPRIIFHLVLY